MHRARAAAAAVFHAGSAFVADVAQSRRRAGPIRARPGACRRRGARRAAAAG